jgi:hypothetical protein
MYRLLDKGKEFVLEVVAERDVLRDEALLLEEHEDGFTVVEEVRHAFYFIYYIFLRRFVLFDCKL